MNPPPPRLIWPQATIWALLAEAYKIKLQATFGTPRPHGYAQGEF